MHSLSWIQAHGQAELASAQNRNEYSRRHYKVLLGSEQSGSHGMRSKYKLPQSTIATSLWKLKGELCQAHKLTSDDEQLVI